jgi:hypothetical protein
MPILNYQVSSKKCDTPKRPDPLVVMVVLRRLKEEELENPPPASTWEEMSMRKFPTFDPAWPDEVKANWFDGLSR